MPFFDEFKQVATLLVDEWSQAPVIHTYSLKDVWTG